MLAIDVEKLIAFEEVVDPTVIEKETLSFQGHYTEHPLTLNLQHFFRHPNFQKKYKVCIFVEEVFILEEEYL